MNWIEGTISENIHWTEFLFSLKIEADVDDFTAGQFTSLALEIDGERVARPYSHLSAPHERPLEFFFYMVPDGKLSRALQTLEPGAKLWVREQSAGFFTLQEVPQARDLWMISTGTGIAPFLSILKTEEPWEKYDNIVLVQGVRKQEDLQYLDLLERFEERFPERFTFQPFVSREEVAGALPGRIPPALESGLLERQVNAILEPENSQLMLCGNPGMVKNVSEILKTRGFQKNLRRKPGHITTENYW